MEYYATGVMSGTSLDGVDMAWCRFKEQEGRWTHEILCAETIPYSSHWEKILRNAGELPGSKLMQLHFEYGTLTGTLLNGFFKKHNIRDPGIIASHGHTIFHQPRAGFTFQLGSGAAIAAETTRDVICDFRSQDVALGGQGAPLVPIGDRLLFAEYDFCLNLGGFANVSYEQSGQRLARDVCPLNFITNRLVQQEMIKPPPHYQASGNFAAFDPEGQFGRRGKVNYTLLNALNSLPYYALEGAKSLGAEWVDEVMWPVISRAEADFYDRLRTYYEHAALQISRAFGTQPDVSVLLSGGGCYNSFFLEILRDKSTKSISFVVPDKATIEFREALIFAFLGVLWQKRQSNCLSSVTGSERNNTGGCLYRGSPQCKT